MNPKIDIERINDRIKRIRCAADDLKNESKGFPAVNRNSVRILASLKMLEINVSDLIEYHLVD